MSDHEKSAELEGKEAERAALAHIRKEQELRTGAVFDQLLLTYLKDGDSPEFRDYLLKKTILYLESVTANPHVIKAAIPDWVIRLIEKPIQILSISGASAEDVARVLEQRKIDSKGEWIEIDEAGKYHYFKDGKRIEIDPKNISRTNVPVFKPADSSDESEDAE